MIKRWRRRRNCFHHDNRTGESWIGSGRIIDYYRKLYRCSRCGRTWFL